MPVIIRAERRTTRPAAPITASGRIAAWLVAACLTVTGIATVALAWNELTCRVNIDPGGSRVAPPSVCEVVAGVGGLFAMAGVVMFAGGLTIALGIRKRPVSESGSDGWRWVLGAMVGMGLAVLVTRFPDQTCPPGVHLSAAFDLCIDLDRGTRYTSQSWLWVKVLGIIAAPAIGLGLVAVRTPIAILVPIALAAWFGGIGWFLLDTIGREFLA
jgi:hypothetical protein